MKQVLMLTILFMCITSCKKDSIIAEQRKPKYLDNVKVQLKESVDGNTYENLDFSRVIKTKISADTSYLRIPLKDKNIGNEFLLLQTNQDGLIKRGRAVSFDRDNNAAQRMTKYRPYNGYIVVKNLKGKKLIESEIENGYIIALHPKMKNHRFAIVPVGPYYTELPEVIVVAYHTQEAGNIYYSDWFSFSGIFSDTYSLYNSYVSMDGYGGSGGGYTDYGYTYDATSYESQYQQEYNDITYQEPAIIVDFEASAYNPAINLQQYLKCFSNIPDAGATCSIEILADIPIDNDPNKILNSQTGSPGHVFLQIKKSNGTEMVVQNIGFYPSEGWKVSISNAPVDGKFVDNGSHEFNASLLMNISPDQLQTALNEIQYLARFIKYDIDEYNCTDFALDVFNKVRHDPLVIPLYNVPGGMTAGGTRTPQGLYNKLKSMQQTNSPEASNISIPGYKGWVALSNGPCN